MQLWTDYEGVTIDGAFPLHKLLLPEGRSAFFSTAGPKGEPALVRLIECHFDEEEILARWRSVEALNHPNFLKFEHYGKVERDGGPVVYAVLETVDANLSAVLDEGHLTVKDVAELAASLVSALQVLHANGFVHEHVEPRNIFAVGEQVKLRCDCIRETPEGDEGRAAMQRDVRDLAAVLLQALTQRQSLEGVPDYAVPPPFDQIIRNGLDGSWGLQEIRVALGGRSRSTSKKITKPVNAAPPTPAAPAPSLAATPETIHEKIPHAEPSIWEKTQLSLPLVDEEPALDEDRTAEFARPAIRENLWADQKTFSPRSIRIATVAIAAALLLFSAALCVHVWQQHRHKAAAPAAAASHPAAPSVKRVSVNSAPHTAAAPAPHAGWRVIAFTYNRKADAEKKAASLALSHPSLHPAVFAPSGRAPWLVSIGGVMDRDAAYALARRSSSLGLPRDTYAQNYSH